MLFKPTDKMRGRQLGGGAKLIQRQCFGILFADQISGAL